MAGYTLFYCTKIRVVVIRDDSPNGHTSHKPPKHNTTKLTMVEHKDPEQGETLDPAMVIPMNSTTTEESTVQRGASKIMAKFRTERQHQQSMEGILDKGACVCASREAVVVVGVGCLLLKLNNET